MEIARLRKGTFSFVLVLQLFRLLLLIDSPFSPNHERTFFAFEPF